MKIKPRGHLTSKYAPAPILLHQRQSQSNNLRPSTSSKTCTHALNHKPPATPSPRISHFYSSSTHATTIKRHPTHASLEFSLCLELVAEVGLQVALGTDELEHCHPLPSQSNNITTESKFQAGTISHYLHPKQNPAALHSSHTPFIVNACSSSWVKRRRRECTKEGKMKRRIKQRCTVKLDLVLARNGIECTRYMRGKWVHKIDTGIKMRTMKDIEENKRNEEEEKKTETSLLPPPIQLSSTQGQDPVIQMQVTKQDGTSGKR
ncbi:hypothetical protein BJ165DRAFT_1410445 [Panaeolus papilionaceus]|nr:hypothetical protein BJ165DRAFT_1410445 [Panaeolus papilionaceus]